MEGKVKIVSGWSAPGGSTIHHINLTNLLNHVGYDCTFYGPHPWHVDKCKGDNINAYVPDSSDTLITHFCVLGEDVPARKRILSLHETNLFKLDKKKTEGIDVIHYVSEFQKEWHGYNKIPGVVIPPIVEKFHWTDPEISTAGVIGSIDSHKQTHLSIEAAKEAGFKHALLFGEITELEYFNKQVMPHLQSGFAILQNHYDSKQEMYDMVSAVFHHSKRETYGLVEAECKLNRIPFYGHENNPEVLEVQEILNRWVNVLA